MKVRRYPKTSATSAPAVLREQAEPITAEPTSGAMLRTQIYLNRNEYDFLQSEARRRGTPMAAVIRSFIDERMRVPEDAWENNPLLAPPADPNFVGPEDGVLNHDHYVYGGPKKWMKRKGKWVETPPLPDDYYTNAKSAAAYDRRVKESQ